MRSHWRIAQIPRILEYDFECWFRPRANLSRSLASNPGLPLPNFRRCYVKPALKFSTS